jgi:hypothetical protein
MPVYKNITDQDQVIANVGMCKAGETIETDEVIENSNFKLATATPPQQPAPQAPAPSTSPVPQTGGTS